MAKRNVPASSKDPAQEAERQHLAQARQRGQQAWENYMKLRASLDNVSSPFEHAVRLHAAACLYREGLAARDLDLQRWLYRHVYSPSAQAEREQLARAGQL